MLYKICILHNIFSKPGEHAALFNPERSICLQNTVEVWTKKTPGNVFLHWEDWLPDWHTWRQRWPPGLRTFIDSTGSLFHTFLPESAPGVTMEGFNNIPSNSTLLSARYLKVAAQISSATSAVLQRQHVVSVFAKGQIVNTVWWCGSMHMTEKEQKYPLFAWIV